MFESPSSAETIAAAVTAPGRSPAAAARGLRGSRRYGLRRAASAAGATVGSAKGWAAVSVAVRPRLRLRDPNAGLLA